MRRAPSYRSLSSAAAADSHPTGLAPRRASALSELIYSMRNASAGAAMRRPNRGACRPRRPQTPNAPSAYRASIVEEIPPREEKTPVIAIRFGRQAATQSRRIRLTAFS